MPKWLLKSVSIGLSISALCVNTRTSTFTFQNAYGQEANSRKKLCLTRTESNSKGTIGRLTIQGATFATLEPPQRTQKPRAIPSGTYEIKAHVDPLTGRTVLRLLSVPGFSGVKLEVGNYPSNTRGCILIGMKHEGTSLLESRKAYSLLIRELAGSDYIVLEILDAQPARIQARSPVRSDVSPQPYSLPIRPS